MAVDRPRVISAGCMAGPVGPCGLRTSLLRVHEPIIQVFLEKRHFTSNSSWTCVQHKPFITVTSFLDDIPGGAIGKAFLERGMQTSQSLLTLFVHKRALLSCDSLARDVGPASCSFRENRSPGVPKQPTLLADPVRTTRAGTRACVSLGGRNSRIQADESLRPEPGC